MSGKVVILGAGAAPGVPSLCMGWGHCNPNNPKNFRLRTSTYVEIDNVRILIDTCPNIREQLIANNIKVLDAVLYTHAHADHVHGIDDMREINRISGTSLNIYGGAKTISYIKHNFSYLIIFSIDVVLKTKYKLCYITILNGFHHMLICRNKPTVQIQRRT